MWCLELWIIFHSEMVIHVNLLIMFEITRVLFPISYYCFPWVKWYTYVQHLVYIFIYIKKIGSCGLIFCMCPMKCFIVQGSIDVKLNLHIVGKETCILHIPFSWSCVFNMFKDPFVWSCTCVVEWSYTTKYVILKFWNWTLVIYNVI